jgi:hypothetical protein
VYKISSGFFISVFLKTNLISGHPYGTTYSGYTKHIYTISSRQGSFDPLPVLLIAQGFGCLLKTPGHNIPNHLGYRTTKE